MKIYVLSGHCGEWDEFREWTVRAYEDKILAQLAADTLNDKIEEWSAIMNTLNTYEEREALNEQYEAALEELDPGVSLDHDTQYQVYELELVSALTI
jgi:hypothetical protein